MSVVFRSVNPKNNKIHKTFEALTSASLENKVDRSYQRYKQKINIGNKGLPRRFEKMGYLQQILAENRQKYAELITFEMGKPIAQAQGEINKCIEHIDYYIHNADQWLQEEKLDLSSGSHGKILTQPLGPTLVIMPWNFPFWLPFKAALPPMVLGNSILMKHSPSTPLCAEALEEAFSEAGFGKGEYQNLFINNDQADQVMADYRIRAVKFTGSTAGGKVVASRCGFHMKKGCFELGGNDPFVVFKDADIEAAVDAAYKSRMGNSGQACINAKRFIISDKVYDEFRDRLVEKVKTTTVIGDPMDPKVNLGPLALERQAVLIKDQVRRAISEGGATLIHGEIDLKMEDPELAAGNYVDAMVLEGMNPESEIYKEEFFGPVFNLFKVHSSIDAITLANKSEHGLAATVFTNDADKARAASERLRVGMVFVNEMVASSSDFPSGGIKGSGFGRECYHDGLLEIGNRKAIISKLKI